MINKKKTLLIWVGVVVLVLVVCGLLSFMAKRSQLAKAQLEVNSQSNVEQVIATDSTIPDCTGDALQPDDKNFEKPITYQGTITSEKKITMVLSCNRKKIVISGAIDQTISSAIFKDRDMDEDGEIVDLIGGSEGVVNTNIDYDKDGFQDLTVLLGNGQGSMAIDTSAIFLFDQKTNSFVYSKVLSAIPNISIAENGDIVSYQGLGRGSYTIASYVFENNKIKIVKSESCIGDKETYDKNNDPGSYTYTESTYDAKDKETVLKTETKKYDHGSCADVSFNEFK